MVLILEFKKTTKQIFCGKLSLASREWDIAYLWDFLLSWFPLSVWSQFTLFFMKIRKNIRIINRILNRNQTKQNCCPENLRIHPWYIFIPNENQNHWRHYQTIAEQHKFRKLQIIYEIYTWVRHECLQSIKNVRHMIEDLIEIPIVVINIPDIQSFEIISNVARVVLVIQYVMLFTLGLQNLKPKYDPFFKCSIPHILTGFCRDRNCIFLDLQPWNLRSIHWIQEIAWISWYCFS